ncbi:hypothetical protein Q1695_012906 [Nippostrongylus brasiliensis]|nr:hypothetical protein Q1695_012906 [Nippostrongylus brasiliensis]
MWLLPLLPTFVGVILAKMATYEIEGTLLCDDKPGANYVVELKFTDLLLASESAAKIASSNNGSFSIRGESKIEPGKRAFIWVEHNCDPKKRVNCEVMSEIPLNPTMTDTLTDLGHIDISKYNYYNSCDDIDA